MSSNDVAIRVQNLSKCYEIYAAPRDRLKQFVLPPLQRLAGRPSEQYFREFWALKDVSFEIKKGETVGIIGRNGSGKSTLLQMICGTLFPTAGKVETKGRVAALLELGSGFNPEFTGRENVYMNAAVLGLSESEVNARFGDIAAFADIGDFIEQPVKIYSSGMYVRLAFAVIAHVDADLLIIDEALSVGDAAFSRKCGQFLRRFMKTGTVLFVSHDTASIKSLCNRVIWLDNGRVVADGDPKRVSDAYLKHFYESQQGKGHILAPTKNTKQIVENSRSEILRDMRQDFLNCTNLRNDIQIFPLKDEFISFGKGGAYLEFVEIQDEFGNPLSYVVGGEMIKLVIKFIAKQFIQRVIIGFTVRDKLGQYLFGDNTHLAYLEEDLTALDGAMVSTIFKFSMPILKAGDYSIDVTLAEGTQLDHIQQIWVHDALKLKSTSSAVCNGLIGIPMLSIDMKIKADY